MAETTPATNAELAPEGRSERDGELFRLLAENVVDDAIFIMDPEGRVRSWSRGAARLFGYGGGEIVGESIERLFTPEDLRAGVPERERREALEAGRFEGDRWQVREDGSRVWVGGSITPLRDEAGTLRGFARIMRDRTDWKRQAEALAERVRLAAFGREIGRAIAQAETLREMLDRGASAMVRHLDAAFARIWTIDESGETLELQASAGLYTHIDGPHGRVPVGRYKIGMIARDRRPHLTNSVIGDPHVPAQDWAEREGMVAFAGYPLLVEGRLIGVAALFSRHELSEATLQMLASVADELAVGVERKRAEDRLHRHREWLQVTLASIGDAVIATDPRGRVSFINPVAEALTGWPAAEAVGVPLAEVFEIVNEQTRQPVENPALRALREGAIVGLANHTILIARGGAERPIDDSAAPIRDERGEVVGAVLIFRDVGERRRSDRALEASEARKASILRTALDAVITIDHLGSVLEWNPAAEAIFYYAEAEALGREMASLIIPPAYRDAHRRGLARYLATGEGPVLGRRFEIEAVRADGSVFPVELAIAPIAADGPPVFTAHVRDISASKAVDRRRNARLAVNEALAVAASVDEAAPAILRAVCEGLGWDLGEFWALDDQAGGLRCLAHWHLPGAGFDRFVADSRRRTLSIGISLPGRVWESGRSTWIPDVTADPGLPRAPIAAEAGLHGAFAAPVILGEEFFGVLEFYSARVREPDPDLLEMLGTLSGQVGQFLDRRRAEDRLREADRHKGELLASLRDSEERFRTMAESIPQLAWMARPDGHIYWYNKRWYAYTGTTPGQMEGWGWRSVHDPAALPSVMERWRASIASGEPFDMVFPLRGADGTYRPFLTRVAPVRGEDGRIAHWFGTNTDIADRQRIEEELRAAKEEAEAANRAKTQFLAVLSHELRTPLNPILLAASSMLERPFEAAELRPTLVMIRQNVNLQARLIDDLLDVMRIVRGKMPLHWEVADCHRLIDRAVQVCRSEVFGHALRLTVTAEARVHHVNADSARLQQVFWNLIKNAVKFTPEGGSIAVRTFHEGDDEGRIVIEVRDTGIGIEPEVLARVFDPFQQGESTITRRYGGLGLGLAICKAIVDAHGGTITVESEGKGRGTTFRVTLKALPEPTEEVPGDSGRSLPDADQTAPDSLRILVVEDEPATIRLMVRLLRGLGHEVTSADTIASALEALDAQAYDLIVSDIGLPDGSGLELMRRAVALRGRLPAIALTGYGMEEDIRRSREAGFAAHLTKPIDFAKLEAMIRQVAPTRT